MSERYGETLAWLYGLEPRGVRLGLERVRAALAQRGDPHVGPAVVHVAGTNGKGSVSAAVEAALRAAGHRTGLYTSPHMHRFVERIRVDGVPIGEDEVVARVGSLRADPDLPPLTFFEHVTVMAFEAFRDAGVSAVVLEVGLGGRLDATNVVEPRVSVVTNVSLEHQQYLGDRLDGIAAEKAGVLKPGVPAVTGARDPVVLRVLERKAAEVGAPLSVAGRDFRLDAGVFVWGAERIEGLEVGLGAPWAAANAELAVAALVAVRRTGLTAVPDEAIRAGLAQVRWPGRFEWIEGKPRVLLDAAHNPAGCRELSAALARTPGLGRLVLLFGALEDKEHEPMLAAFDGVVDARVYALPAMRRAPALARLAAVRRGEVASGVDEGLALARAGAGPEGTVVVCGSIFLVAAVRARLLSLAEDPPIGM